MKENEKSNVQAYIRNFTFSYNFSQFLGAINEDTFLVDTVVNKKTVDWTVPKWSKKVI